LWDLTTETPRFTLKGHRDWVLCTAWSPDGRMLATGGKDGTLFVWDAVRGRAAGPGLQGHRKWVTAVSWEPMHSNARGDLLASASKDLLVKIWNWRTGRCLHQLSGHTASVTCLRWGGQGLIYSGEQRTPHASRRMPRTARGFGIDLAHRRGGAHGVNATRRECADVDAPTRARFPPSRASARAPAPRGVATSAGSQDRTIKVWVASQGTLARSLEGHGHWVNCLAVSTDHALRCGTFDHRGRDLSRGRGGVGALGPAEQAAVDAAAAAAADAPKRRKLAAASGAADAGAAAEDAGARAADADALLLPDEEALAARSAAARARYDTLVASTHGRDTTALADDGTASGCDEILASCSDDFTTFLWRPASSKKAIVRLQGHQRPVNALAFSPDGRLLASASFDGSVRLWQAADGKFVCALRGHVGPVYQVGWSGDSRLVVSGSRDSTMKVWEVASRKLKTDLPGHADEVFAVDWSPDGQRVASGGKDKMLKFWRA
jgi:ribosome assembly protein 4